MSTLNIQLLCRKSKKKKKFLKLSLFASWPGTMINPQWLEVPMSRTIFYGPKAVRAIEVRRYVLRAYKEFTHIPLVFAQLATQQAHNVEKTSIQHWFNFKTLNQRLVDVVSTLCANRLQIQGSQVRTPSSVA